MLGSPSDLGFARASLGAAVVFAVLAAGTAFAEARDDSGCPAPEAVLDALRDLDLDSASRGGRFETPFPDRLYRKAAERPGRPAVEREGNKSFAALLIDLPVESVWMAVNDESRHADFLPLAHSEVIEGTARGERRLVLQSFKRMGFGRWWVNEVRVNRDLYARSGEALWEVWWRDRMDDVDRDRPPIREVNTELAPLRRSRGSWLLVPLADRCTLVEFFSWSEPGGVLGAFQGLLLTRTVRATLEGVTELSEAGADEATALPPFVRPDGTRIGSD